MVELFTTYSLSEVIILIIILCLAIKEAVTFYDWSKTRILQGVNKNLKDQTGHDRLQHEIDDMNEVFCQKEKRFEAKKQEIGNQLTEMETRITLLEDKLNILINSDKDDIKAYIVDKHHHFCYGQKWIDDYSLDCLERRYTHYTTEGGNSFVADLMMELRALPKRPL